MATIRKNTNEYKRAFSKMVNLRVYSLENDFLPKLVSQIPSFALEMGKLVKMMDHYCFRVHSNLWYEWTAA